MAGDDDVAAAVRAALSAAGTIREVKMFGGIGFMLNGNMVAAVSKRGLLVRVGKDRQQEALARPGAQPMIMRGRVMEGYIRIAPPELSDEVVHAWVELALLFVRTLPSKLAARKAARGK